MVRSKLTALYFEKPLRKKIALLNLLGNMSQLACTVLFGIIGSLFLLSSFKITIGKIEWYTFFGIIIVLVSIYLLLKKLNLLKRLDFYRGISTKIFIEIIGLSVFRYVVFSHQFYFLCLIFNLEIPYFTCISIIFSMYFLASL